MIADVLRSFASERCNDWPQLVQLVEFAINNSVSTLGSGYTPFYADRCQHPRRPLRSQRHQTLWQRWAMARRLRAYWRR
jgi:hypothetical protein